MGFISRIILKDFRNYPGLEQKLEPGITVLKGLNGHGKTAFLESLGFLSLLRSIRGSNIKYLKRWDADFFNIRATLSREGLPELDLNVNYGEKRSLSIDSCKLATASEFLGPVKSVAFMPEDIEIIKGSASYRRQFLDILLSQLSPAYLYFLKNYSKVLKNRNQVLKNSPNPRAELSIWNDLLIEHGKEVLAARAQWVPELENAVHKIVQEVKPEGFAISLAYQSSCVKENSVIEDSFAEKLRESLERDLLYKTTHVGPHRDELNIRLDGRALSKFGSEGQCRLSSLILKAASVELLLPLEQPDCLLLLIDDVLGELDEFSRKAFIKCISRGDQVFIACTEIPLGLESYSYKLLNVKDGQVS